MNKNPLISVIVPCYNVEKYVGQCLESILSQSYENIEVLVINDGSTDNTEQEITPFLKDDRIKYFVQKNAGLSEARNAGLREIQKNGGGEYVCFIDSDDYIHQDYLKILYENLIKYDADISICDLFYDYSGKLELYNKEMTKKDIFVHNRNEYMEFLVRDLRYIVAWCKLYKTSLFDDLFYKPGKIHEDEFIAHHIFWRANKVVRTIKPLYFYRKAEGSITTSEYTISKHQDAIDAIQDRLNFYKKHNIPFIDKLIDRKWYIIYFRGLRELNFLSSKKYIINHPIEFLFEFRGGSKKYKIKLYFKILLNVPRETLVYLPKNINNTLISAGETPLILLA